jgi:hypothetical protein
MEEDSTSLISTTSNTLEIEQNPISIKQIDNKSYYQQGKRFIIEGSEYIHNHGADLIWLILISILILLIFTLIGMFGRNNQNNSDITRKNINANGNCTIDGTLTVGGKPYNAGGSGDGGTYTYGDTLFCSQVNLNTDTYIKNGCGNAESSCIDFIAPLGYNFYAGSSGTGIYGSNNVLFVNTNGATIYSALSIGSSISAGITTFQMTSLDNGSGDYAGTRFVNMGVSEKFNNCLDVSTNIATQGLYLRNSSNTISVELYCATDKVLQVDGNINCTMIEFSGNCNIYSDAYNTISFGGGAGGTIYCGTIYCGTVISNDAELTSDYRLKENIIPIPDDYSVDNLNPCVYNLKESPEKLQTGFIAHELQEVFPHLVNGEKDGEKMQSVNYIQLIAILTKEIQDLKKRVLQLESTSKF